MSRFQENLRALLVDRNRPEAQAFFLALMQYVDHKATALWSRRWSDVLDVSEREEVVGQVMVELLSGALARFEGETLGQLYAYVRTITERSLLASARNRLKARQLAIHPELRQAERWGTAASAPDAFTEDISDNPLSPQEQGYLIGLLQAGGQAEYARQQGVTRAAVTLRLQRIRQRVEAMQVHEQHAVHAWCERVAEQVEFAQAAK